VLIRGERRSGAVVVIDAGFWIGARLHTEEVVKIGENPKVLSTE